MIKKAYFKKVPLSPTRFRLFWTIMIEKKDNRITFLGSAAEYLPVIFDACYDAYGSTEFHIYKNIKVDSLPKMPVRSMGYAINFYEPAEKFQKIGEHIFFGVVGPFGKRKVFEYFRDKWNLEKDDISVLVHPETIIAPSANWESAALIEPSVVISSQTRLGFAVTIKRKVSIGHHCTIEDFVEINPGVTVSGHVTVGAGAIIGSGAVIRNGITIGENSVIGMGSVVTKDIPDHVIAFGNPCKVVRENPVRE